MADVFISYAREDAAQAEAIESAVTAAGYTCWSDRSLMAGDTYPAEIGQQLAAARIAVVLWSNASKASRWVIAEAARADAHGKLVPLRTSDLPYAELPLPYNTSHTPEAHDMSALLAAIHTKIGGPKSTIGRAEFLAMLRRATFAIAGTVTGTLTLSVFLTSAVHISGTLHKLLDSWVAILTGLWQEVLPVWIEITSFEAVSLTTTCLVTAAMLGAATRWHQVPVQTKVARTFLALSLLLTSAILGAGLLRATDDMLRKYDQFAATFIRQRFAGNPECVAELERIVEFGRPGAFSRIKQIPDEPPLSLQSACALLTQSEVVDLKLAILGAVIYSDKRAGVVQHVQASLGGQPFTTLIVGILALLFPIWLPTAAFLATKRWHHRSINARALAWRLGIPVIGACALVLLDKLLIVVSRVLAAS